MFWDITLYLSIFFFFFYIFWECKRTELSEMPTQPSMSPQCHLSWMLPNKPYGSQRAEHHSPQCSALLQSIRGALQLTVWASKKRSPIQASTVPCHNPLRKYPASYVGHRRAKLHPAQHKRSSAIILRCALASYMDFGGAALCIT